MKGSIPSKAAISKRVTDELKEFAVIAVYLYICFTAILYLKASILKAHNIEFAPFGFAAVKALICAKFVPLGHIFHVGERFRFKTLPLIWPTLYKSGAFLVFLIILNALEEIVVGLIHGRAVTVSLAEFGGGTLDRNKHSGLADFNSVLCLSYPRRASRRAEPRASISLSPPFCRRINT